jgi:chaperonin GroES
LGALKTRIGASGGLDRRGRRNYLPDSLLALICRECQQAFPCPFAERRRGVFGVIKEDCNMAFRPLHDRVVVKRLEGEEKTKGGIIIPDSAKEKPQEGKIVAVGPGARDESGKLVPLDVKAGDRILFGKWSGTEVKVDGDDLLIMKESDVLGIVE